jgi:hypothetical protein
VDELPADAMVAIDSAGIPPADAMSHRADPAKLFDTEMDQFAWVLALGACLDNRRILLA